MNDAEAEAAPALEQALRRLEELTSALDEVEDSSAKEAAQELLDLVFDLHGLGLARMSAVIATAADAPALTERLITDPYVRAILLLHGLHPRSPVERLRDAIDRMRPQWDRRGFSVELVSARSGSAHVRIRQSGSRAQDDLLRNEVEGVLVDAAPDLDDLDIEVVDAPTADGSAF
jgi:hypothetical protein